jgi:hypothetical protein
MKEHSREFIYSINENYRIDFVNDDWLDFAAENGAAGLKREDVLNQSIWNFISDRETEHIFGVLFKKLQSSKASIKLPFRCDSPDCRRHMQMEISPRNNTGIQFRTWVVREEKRPSVPLLDFGRERSEQLLRMCSWCKKVLIKENNWHEVEEVVALLELFESGPLPQFTHTICPPCAELFWAEIDAEQGQNRVDIDSAE